MKGKTYINIIKNEIIVDSPNYIKQKLINELRVEGICTNKKSEQDKLSLRGLSTREEKIKEAIAFNMNSTLKLYEEIEFKKAYKYVVVFKFESINREGIINNARDINSLSFDNINEVEEFDITKPIISVRDSMIYLKFTKNINISCEDLRYDRTVPIRYPIVVAINLEEEIFDIRFDRLYLNNDESFYNLCIDSALLWLRSNSVTNITSIDLDPIVKYALENRANEIEEVISSFGLKKEKGATLKAGKDKVMPFIGDLKNLLKSNSEAFTKSEDTKKCLDIINGYISDTERFADYKYRILNIIKKNVINEGIYNINEDIGVKIIFNYRRQGKDLINFYNPEINNLERINHVVRYIKSIESGIK